MGIYEDQACPACKADLKGDPIPDEYLLSDNSSDRTTHYSRVIGCEYTYDNPNRYDGVSEWRCPDCDYREGRWSGKELKGAEFEKRHGGV
jgi:hypothetical protein